MATATVSGALFVSALVLLSAAYELGAARPQLTLRAADAVIGLDAGAAAREETAAVNLCGKASDEICSLPGLNGAPHVRMRSGYITVSEVSDRRLWYLVAGREGEDPQQPRQQQLDAVSSSRGTNQQQSEEQQSEAAGGEGGEGVGRRVDGDADEDAAPVILWLTGGPGCSSLDAFIYEHGPFRFSYADERVGAEAAGGAGAEEGEGLEGEGRQRQLQQRQRQVLLQPNPYSWTKLATVIYVDSPAGAGFSFSGRPDVDYHTNDEYTIADLVKFLQGLTERYPELARAPFFLAGESYGGVFVPLLARELVAVNRGRAERGERPLVELRGYSVGNPVTDDVIDGNAQMWFAADMGYVDPPTWRHIREACDDMFWNATMDTECYDAQGVVKDDLWDLNWYDVLDACVRPDDDVDREAPASKAAAAAATTSSSSSSRSSSGGKQPRDPVDLERRFYWPFTARRGAPKKAAEEEEQQQQQLGVACGEREPLEAGRRGGRRLWGPWLRHVVPCMDRRIALDWLNRDEVRSALHAAPASSIGGWQPCSDVLYYRLDTMDLVGLHEELVREGIRALVYSGDHDMVVPHTGTRTWVYDKANLGSPDGPLRPWMMNGQIAGFTARFGAGVGLRFATVKGAGHMVPQSKPAQALRLLGAFLRDEEL